MVAALKLLHLNAYGHKRDPLASVHAPHEFYACVKDKSVGDLMPAELFIMDARDGTIPLWHVVGRAALAPGELGLCLANLESELMPRTPVDAPLTIALCVSSDLALRTKGPYQRERFPDLADVCRRLQEPMSKITAMICPFTIQVRCKGCNTTIVVPSYPPEKFNNRYCIVCLQKRKRYTRK